MSKLALRVKDFRAIANAEIELDGITVISGINSAGKSTLSKLLYYIVKLTLEQEKIITDNLIYEVGTVLSSLSRLLDELQPEPNEFQSDNRKRAHIQWLKNTKSSDIESLSGLFSSLLGDIEKSFRLREEQKPLSK